MGWIGKSALLVTNNNESDFKIIFSFTNAPLKTGFPITESNCGGCNVCKLACKGHDISGLNWNTSLSGNDFL